jgi:hypothetical protein
VHGFGILFQQVVLLGQLFYDIVTADHFLHDLQQKYSLFFQGMGVSFGETFF